MQSDLALAFDASVAPLLATYGFVVADRSKHSAVSFLVGDGNVVKVRDAKGRVFASPRDYVDHRLRVDTRRMSGGGDGGAAGAVSGAADLSHAKLCDLVWDVLATHSVPGAQKLCIVQAQKNGLQMRADHERFMAKTFPRALRKVFAKHDLPVPEALRPAAGKCCAYCGSTMAAASQGDLGGIGSTLKLGACSRCKKTYYCRDKNCQKDHWTAHKEACKILCAESQV
jgi:hypothetical protein